MNIEKKHEDYANNQIRYIMSQPRYLLAVIILSVIGVAGFYVRLELGHAWASTVGLLIMLGGATILAMRVHKKAGSPSSDDLMN